MARSLAQDVECGEIMSTVGEIYAAIENPSLWPSVLERIADLVEGESILLFSAYANSVAKDIRAVARCDESIWRPYQEHYATVNVWVERCDRIFPPGETRYSDRAITDAELAKTEFHADFLKPNGIQYGFGIEIPLPNQKPALLSAMRTRKRGPFGDREGRILKALLPHLQRALQLHVEMTRLRSVEHGMEQALEAFDRALIGVSGNGQIIFCNRAANRLLEARDGVQLEGRRIVATCPAESDELQFLLEQAAMGGMGLGETGATLISRKYGKPPLRLLLMPMTGNVLGHLPGLAALLFIDDPARKPLSRAAALRKLFCLTPAEARLADLLQSGLGVREAADRLGITWESARFSLKRVLAKTNTGRQTELMRLMSTLPGQQHSS